MAVYVSNIVIEQGCNFDATYQLEDTRTNSFLNLTGSVVKSEIRKTYSSTNYVSFASTISDPENGKIAISLNPEQTLSLKPGRYVYDVKIISGNKEYKGVEGSALVRAGVTKQ
tara:strand:- start:308 stop:646 length:339 start_codon:yes stop_codon:yes gene_type:complete